MESIEQVRGMLSDRLELLSEEQRKIERALQELSGKRRRGPKPGRPRKRRNGTRSQQALKLIKDNPGVTAGAIAKTMKIKPNYMYRVMSDLEKQKLVRKKGRQYTAA